MISVSSKGDTSKTEAFLKNLSKSNYLKRFDKYGQMGVEALIAATPYDTGKTAASWDYQIVVSESAVTIEWTNDNINKNVPIAVILQYGHGTGTGGYVQGIDYINPAMQPVFDKIVDSMWKEVTS